MNTVLPATSTPKSDDMTRNSGSQTTASSGIVHVFSSSYLGRLLKNPFSLSNIAPFKLRPMRGRTERYALPERPITGRACSNCFESTVLNRWDSPTGQQRTRLLDVLNLPSTAYKASYNFIKRLADIVYCARMDISNTYPRIEKAVLTCERVKDGISKNVTRLTDEEEDTLRSLSEADLSQPTRRQQHQAARAEILLGRERVRARSILRRMRAQISGWSLKIAAYILFKLLRLILRTVQISPSQVEKIKKASQENIPMIYLPNHRSHLDYILLSFTLAQFGIRSPHVAAGDNLDIPVFSWILRSLGAFYIKRRLDKDHVYRAILHSYIEELLGKGESLEFFMEAGRSRTGRPILPKAGLLSVVIETYLQGRMSNAYLVPVSVSYEKLIEGGFSTELMGEPKKKETFWGACKGIWKVFCTKYGSVRIDFGQPVTVKDFLDRLRDHLPPLPNSDAAVAMSSVFDFCHQQQRLSKSMSSRNSLLSLCSGIDSTHISDEHRRLIKALCNHIVYDFSQNTALMCTQMLSFLLTTKYRRGGRLDDVAEDFHWLCRRVMANGRDVGFSGDPRDVVRYAVELLGPDLVTTEISDVDSGVGSDGGYGSGWNAVGSGARHEKEVATVESHLWLVKPATTLPRILELTYYSAPVGLAFLRDSVIANALLSISREANKPSSDTTGISKSSTRSNTVHSSKVIDRALALTDLLQHEFLFARACESTRQKLEQTMERMVQEGLLVKRGCSTGSMTSTGSSSSGVRFCLDKNQTYVTSPSSATSSRGSSASLAPLDDDSASTQVSDKFPRRKRNATDEAFYLPSEDDDLADMEDEADDDDDEMFSRRYSSSLFSQRRSSYGIASLVDSEDDYNADVIRLYASILAPLLETYKFAFKNALAELAQPAVGGTLMKTQWKTESEVVRKLMRMAKEMVRESSPGFVYAEFACIEPMRNAIRWLILKGVLIANNDRLRLHDSYVDDRETLERFCAEIDDLCLVVTY